jgi:phosphatidate phosphatase APP1
MRPLFFATIYRVSLCLLVILPIRAGATQQSVVPDVGLKHDEHVLFFRSYGYRTDGNRWRLEIRGRIWRGSDAPDDAADASPAEMFSGKLLSFFSHDVIGRHLRIDLSGLKDVHIDVQSGATGEFEGSVIVSQEQIRSIQRPNQWSDGEVRFALAGSTGDPDSYGQIYLVTDSGISIVSDIDDTIRDSHVWNPSQAMVRGFGQFRPVPNMSGLYRYWATHSNARFHYVSGGPDWWEKATERGLDGCGFPSGSVDLREVSLSHFGTVHEWFGGNPCQYKIKKISQILQAFPNRRFCLIGDAGEGDKRALRRLAERFSNVKWVFIRHLPVEDFVNATRYANDPECVLACPTIPASVDYKDFRLPSELNNELPRISQR